MSPHVLDQLSPYLDGELSPTEAASVQAHLRDCPSCAGRLAELAAVDELARGLPVETPAGYYESFPSRVRERLPWRKPEPRRLPVWALAAAAVLLVAVITPLTLRERSLRPAVTEMPRSVEAPAAPSLAPPKEADRQPVRGELEQRPTRKAEIGRGRPEAGETGGPGRAATVNDAEEERGVLAKRQAPTTPPLPQAVAAPAPPPAPARDRAAAAAPSAGGPMAQSQTQSQAPGTFAPQPAGVPAPKALQDDRALEEKVAVEGALAKPKGDRLGANQAAAGPEDADAEFEALRARRVGTASEARDLSAAWRRFAAENPSHPRVDEARVAAIEEGTVAFRLGHRPADRAQVEADVKAYLAGPNPAKADRVRALLASLNRF